MMPCALLFILLLAAFGIPACGGENANGDGGNGNQDGSDQDGNGGDNGGGDNGGGDTGPKPDGPICNEVEIVAGSIPPNLMLVVDKSGSMDDDDTCAVGCNLKIEDAKTALVYLLNEGMGQIRFGWMPYPTDSSCGPGIVDVPCGDDTVATIIPLVNGMRANGGTPTGETLEAANADPDMHDESRSNFVLLLTDGLPTCPFGAGRQVTEQDKTRALNAVTALHQAGIDTFVIGLGETLNNAGDPALLNDMAVAGGRARAGADKNYKANSLNELQAALQDIGGMVIGCNLSLSEVPEEPNYLWVYFDGVPVPRDRNHINGWDYDPDRNQVNFYGPACDQLRSGQVDKVDIKMGCAPPD
jgi:hypothetical protein